MRDIPGKPSAIAMETNSNNWRFRRNPSRFASKERMDIFEGVVMKSSPSALSTDHGRDERPQFCHTEPERRANCRPGRRHTKYYFNHSADRCLSMQSVGCERSSRNLFETLAECEEACDSHTTGKPCNNHTLLTETPDCEYYLSHSLPSIADVLPIKSALHIPPLLTARPRQPASVLRRGPGGGPRLS